MFPREFIEYIMSKKMACECGMIENAYKTYIELSDSPPRSAVYVGVEVVDTLASRQSP